MGLTDWYIRAIDKVSTMKGDVVGEHECGGDAKVTKQYGGEVKVVCQSCGDSVIERIEDVK